jgi:hypothetical protein
LYQFKDWMNKSGWMFPRTLQEENGWTFGQLLSLLLLGAAPLSLVNAWSGESLGDASELCTDDFIGFNKKQEEDKSSERRESGFYSLPPLYQEIVEM